MTEKTLSATPLNIYKVINLERHYFMRAAEFIFN